MVYVGTHDNDTARGWWSQLSDAQRGFAASYLAADADNVHWALIRAACNSVANVAIVTMQDVLGLDGAHRMNLPGTPTGNWGWRFDWGRVGSEPARTLVRLAAASGRAPFALLQA